MRALAIGLVLGAHVPLRPVTGWGPLDALLAAITRGGWIGVDLFFVLSGFLVSGLLFREHQRHGSIRVGRFLIRRGLRIYPPFYVFLTITVAAYVALGLGHRIQPHMLLGEIFYLQNYVGQVWGHTWSLAIEEHFYLLLPLLLIVLARRQQGARFGGVIPVYGVVALICLTLRWDLRRIPFDFYTHLTPTHLRIDSLLIGVVVAYLYHLRPEVLRPWFGARRRGALALVCAALVAPPFVYPIEVPWITWLGFWLYSLGFAALLIAGLGTRLEGRAWGPLAAIGVHSYSIYLWHFPVRAVTQELAQRAGVTSALAGAGWVAIYGVVSVAGGIALAKAVEAPLIRLRDRRFPRRECALEAPRAP